MGIWYELYGFGSPLGEVIGGFDKAFLHGIKLDTYMSGVGIPEILFALFQCMFAVITPALIIGAFAERIKFSGYVVFIILWSIIVYNPMAHWVWGGGWLMKMGAIDFAEELWYISMQVYLLLLWLLC